MKLLRLRMPSRFRDNQQDLESIVKFMKSKGYVIIWRDAYEAWRSYSNDNFAAGWIGVSDENLEEFLSQRERYFEEDDQS